MKFGSLFSGIGGLDLGLERAGMQCAWQVEIDPYASRVLAKHWPSVPRFSDVRAVGAHNLPAVDLICGGFPCQDISRAGKRVGIDGERSGLWSEFARIIRQLRPRFVLVENVAALLGRGLGRVLGDLADLGFDAEWSVLSACALGAPHLRERVFIVAYPNGFNGSLGLGCRSRYGRPIQRCGERASRKEWMATEPIIGGVADGIPNWMERLRCLGNAALPQAVELIGRQILAV